MVQKNSEINFLTENQADKIKLREALMSSLKKSGLILAAWLLILSLVLGYGLFLGNTNKTLRAEAKRLDESLLQLNDRITLILILKDRLEKIDGIFNQRRDLSQPLNSFFATIPAGVTLERITLNDESLIVSGTGDILSISRLTQSYIAGEQDWYRGATLRSLVKSEKDVSFSFDLLINL